MSPNALLQPTASEGTVSHAEHGAPIIPAPCTTPADLLQLRKARQTQKKLAAGFTLIELMITVSVAGVLSSVAYPSFMDQVQRVRRTDAVVAMMQVQWAQERWRSNSNAYGTLAQIGASGTSPAGHYTVAVSSPSADGYDALATATGPQARDTNCAHLKLSMQGANVVYSSGPDANLGNAADVNRRCWSL
jgi:type IV pilus assembly protein PilE